MSSATDAEARIHFDRLVAQVDAFFARVEERHGDQMDCGRGCSECCAPDLTVTPIEASVIAEHLQTMASQEREALAARARAGDSEKCVALESDGSCAIYAARPVVCRSHGVPIVESHDGGLPVISVCPRNFRAEGALESTEGDCRLHATGLSMRLLAIDSALVDAHGEPRGQRLPLESVLTS